MEQTKNKPIEFTLQEICLAIANWEAYLKQRPHSSLAHEELEHWNKLNEEVN